MIASAIGDPDPVLLVDPQVERHFERLARFGAVTLANDPSFGPITLREENELALLEAERPDISARRDDHTLHQAELAPERDAIRRGQRVTVLVEDGDRLAAGAGEPGVVLGIDGGTESSALHAAAREACGHG